MNELDTSMAMLVASESSASILRHDTPIRLAQINIAIDASMVEIFRPLKPSWPVWTSSNAQHIISHSYHAQCTVGKAIPTERSALNQALAKALAFRDAGKMQEAREWAGELVRLLKSHDLLT